MTRAKWNRREKSSTLRAGAFCACAYAYPTYDHQWFWTLAVDRVVVRSGHATSQAKAESAARRSLRTIVVRAWRALNGNPLEPAPPAPLADADASRVLRAWERANSEEGTS